MNYTAKVIIFLGTVIGSPLVSAQSAGQYCPMVTSVVCKLDNGEDCVTLADLPYLECGVHTLNWKYEFCNANDDGKRIRFFTGRKGNGEQISGAKTEMVEAQDFQWDSNDLGPACRQPVDLIRVVDTCVKSSFAAELKLQGRLLDGSGNLIKGDDYYCYGYAFQRIRIRAKPDIVGNIPPEIKLDIKCLYEENEGSGNFNKDCSTLSNVSPPKGQCKRDVIFRHTVQNIAGTSRLQAVVDGNNDNLLGDGNSFLLASSQAQWIDDKEEELDLCTQAGETITRKAVAVAAADPEPSRIAQRIAQASASVTVVLPNTSPVYEFIDPKVGCTFNGQDCGNYIDDNGCFAGEVELKYTIKNVGDTCHNIQSFTARMNDADPRAIAINCADSNSCPGSVWPLLEKRYIDFCDASCINNFSIEVKTDAGEYTTSTEGSLCENTGTTPTTKPPTLPPTPLTKPPTLPPTPLATAPPTSAPTPIFTPDPKVCSSTPYELTFVFNANECANSDNNQFRFIRHKKRRNLRSLKKDDNSKDDKSKKDKGNSSKYDKEKKDKGDSSKYDKEKKDKGDSSKYDKAKKDKGDSSKYDKSKKDKSDDSMSNDMKDDGYYYCSGNLKATSSTTKIWYKVLVFNGNESKVYYTGNICDGTTFTFGHPEGFTEDLILKVYDYDEKLLQTVSMNASCACDELETGQLFGSFKLESFIS